METAGSTGNDTVFLHGTLDVTIFKANHLPITFSTQATSIFKKYVCCGMLPDLVGSCDPYCCMDVGLARRLRTTFIKNATHPVWNEHFEVYVADEAREILFSVKDADLVGAEHLGSASIPAKLLLDGKQRAFTLKLVDQVGAPVGKKHKTTGIFDQATLQLTIKYNTVEQVLDSVKRYGEVPRSYFPMRTGCLVRLYHDAHQPPGPVPDVLLGNGHPYEEWSCWDDVFAAIMGAQRFIWIIGWSVWVNTVLKRHGNWSIPLGELLKGRAEKGVKVLLLVWDDKSNNSGLHPGVMATHDQETYDYFKGTGVVCLLCPREGGTEDTLLQGTIRGNAFSHHQKCILLDGPPKVEGAAGPTGLRQIISFVGGLDLCDGRYDTGEHALFRTTRQGGAHYEDFHQACIDGLTPSKQPKVPREPWHDIHARVEGAAAYDIGLNFLQRWNRQRNLKRFVKALDNSHGLLFPKTWREYLAKLPHRMLLKGGKHLVKDWEDSKDFTDSVEELKRIETLINVTEGANPISWNVQVFRSIDSDSARGFPKMSHAYAAGLKVGKGKSIDPSISRAYLHNIRRAEHFIYIENQYFLGSCHLWDSDQDSDILHLVPAEIALKICSKIKAGQSFCCYVVLPMFPEGPPTSTSVQNILLYQHNTMRMMYKRIAEALQEARVTDRHPTDYLQFYCLGNREPLDEVVTASVSSNRDLAASCTIRTISSPISSSSTTPAPSRRTSLEDRCSRAGGGMTTTTTTKADTSIAGATAESRRFMIYVHSKMMIVDDEYIIVGSANINQRSMDGSRDTEIAVGAFQPAHTLRSPLEGNAGVAGSGHGGGRAAVEREGLPRGAVSGFRRVLWKEHCGGVLPEHSDDPGSLSCARTMRALGQKAWGEYSSPAVVPLSAHLLAYPIAVGEDGTVGAIPGQETFPDVGGKVLGSKTKFPLPPVLTG